MASKETNGAVARLVVMCRCYPEDKQSCKDIRTIIDALNQTIAERDRLRELVEEAYHEGWDSGRDLEHLHTNWESWLQSNTRAALQDVV